MFKNWLFLLNDVLNSEVEVEWGWLNNVLFGCMNISLIGWLVVLVVSKVGII